MTTPKTFAKNLVKFNLTREQFVYIIPETLSKKYLKTKWVWVGKRGKGGLVLELEHTKEITQKIIDEAIELLPSFWDKEWVKEVEESDTNICSNCGKDCENTCCFVCGEEGTECECNKKRKWKNEEVLAKK